MWTNDPIADAENYSAECEDNLKKYPVCDECGDYITDETYRELVYRGKILRFHDHCIETQYTSDYIEERRYFQ